VPRFLLISPDFPPSAKLGAKRGGNLATYLPDEGWEPVVLCCPEPGAGQWAPASSRTSVHRSFTSPLGRALRRLSGSVPSRSSVPSRATPSEVSTPGGAARERRNPVRRFLNKPEISPLDQYLWDLPWVVRSAVELARREGVAAVAVNADPWSGLVVGAALARRLDLPFVADMRDPWALHPRKAPRRPALTQRAIAALELRLLARADRVVLNTERCAAAYRAHYAGVIDGSRFTFIRNAFDPAIADAGSGPPPGRDTGERPFEVHYFGTIDRGRDPLPFYRGFEQFVRAHGLTREGARIVFYGNASAAADPRVARLSLTEFVEVRPKATLRDGIAQLRGADALLLLEGPDRSLQLPAKLYDYFAAGRPILAVGANDELRGILEETAAGFSTRTDEGPEAVAAQLAELYRARGSRLEPAADLSAFGARAQAARYREELEAAVHHHYAGRNRGG
jgi:hypothetical protein